MPGEGINYAFEHGGLKSGVLCSCNCVTKGLSDRNLVEDGASANHGNGRNGHRLNCVEASPITTEVIMLKCRNCLCDDLCFGIFLAKTCFILLNNQEYCRAALN